MTFDTLDSAGPTAVSVIDDDDSMDPKKRKKPKRRRSLRKDGSYIANYNFPGVIRIYLNVATQKALSCIVGEQVTAENPWTTIQKDSIEYHIEVHEENSEFNEYKEDIAIFPKDELLIGYIPDEARENDEYYLCLTLEAEERVRVVIKQVLERQQERLNNSILKRIGSWNTFGSSGDVDMEMYSPNRELIEVEIEAKYPIISSKIQFRLRLALDVKDGYAEFKSDKAGFNNVFKRRIDCAVQVAPAVRNNVAQTTCAFPKNTWTQYYYEFDPIEKLPKEFTLCFKKFTQELMPTIHDIIDVNSRLNLFTDDYNDLVKDKKTQKSSAGVQLLEYNSFTDIKYCKYKMISGVSWHPLISGILGVCYKSTSPNAYTTYKPDFDHVNYQVHSTHVVLIWSFKDVLQAKLYLEAPREIDTISFCPFDENILIGGLSNGQVAIWDITNMLKRSEAEEILTYAQQKYRVLMFSHMDWFKNTRDITRIRCTAISNLMYSHEGPVTSISWMAPDCAINHTGKLYRIPEAKERTMQFTTTSVDGTLMFWDLKAKITLQPGDYRPQRRSKRLKTRPSALTLDVSPLRILNRLFKPIFIVNMVLPSKGTNMYVSCYNRWKPIIECIPLHRISRYKRRMDDRIFHTPVAIPSDNDTIQRFYAGTLDGYFFTGGWDGFEVDAGEVINKENCKILNIGRFHDGPIVSISRNKYNPDLILTCGGKVLAVWSENLPDRPILWRRSRHRYTFAAWNIARRNLFRICRSDGNRETWSLLERSYSYMFEQSLSGKILTGSYIHRLKMKNNVNAIADYNGTLRLLYTPTQIGLAVLSAEAEVEENYNLGKQFNHECERKKQYLSWQETWNNKHATWIKAKKEQEIVQQKLKEEQMEQERIRKEEERINREREEYRLRMSKLRPPPGRYLEWAKEMYIEKEEKRMARVLLSKKHLDPDLLREQQAPLRAIKEEQQQKKLKQKQRLQHSQQLFNDTVTMLFPNVVKSKIVDYVDPYAGGDLAEIKTECVDQFSETIEENKEYIQDHVYDYKFDWKDVVVSGGERRRMLDVSPWSLSHRNRLSDEKQNSHPAALRSSVTSNISRSDDDYAADKEDSE